MKNMQLSLTPSPFDGTQLCLEVDSDIFFPEYYTDADVQTAKSVCNQCWMKDDCLKYALDNNEREGIWGATTPRERKNIKRRKKK